MRIIAGELKGRVFDAPKGKATHPMSEKIRAALFNTLGDIHKLQVLDAYGGSGALAFEAISRGAISALVIEINKQAHKVILNNISQLDIADRVKAVRANCISWSENNPDKVFDLIVADPPYGQHSILHLNQLAKHLKVSGIMVLSYTGRTEVPAIDGVVVVDTKSYGDSALTFYRKG